MRITSVWTASAVGVGLALVLSATAVSAAVPDGPPSQVPSLTTASPDLVGPSDDVQGGEDAGSTDGTATPPAADGKSKAAVAQEEWHFSTKADHAHTKEKSATLREVSVHGWWEYISPQLATYKADVKVKLQQYDAANGKWETKKTETQVRKPKNTAGSQRTNVRMNCKWKNRTARWRAVVDVDIQGIRDSADVTYGDETVLYCQV